MGIGDDYSVAVNGDIRYTGSGANYSNIEFHRWLQGLVDDAAASGDDLADITSETPSNRSTDTVITLLSPYNIDDVAARHLYNGSITQDNGDTIYEGIRVIAPAGTYVQIIQNGSVLVPNFWTTGINPDATTGTSHRFLVKVRSGGVDIDGRRLIGQTREFGPQGYSEFVINGTERGNNVIALSVPPDTNNQTAEATVASWTTIANTEGYRSLDVDNNGTPENYYSEWDISTFTINQFYERMKWLSRRAGNESSNTNTGTNYALGNGTITKQAQSFAVGATAVQLARFRCKLKKVGAPTGNAVAILYAHTGTFGSSGTPTGAALATSSNFDVSKLTTSYEEAEFGFATTAQALMSASTNYFVSLEYSGGDGSNYVHVEGTAADTHAGNRAEYAGSWSASSGTDLWFQAVASPRLYGLPGEMFRGITHELTVDTPSGTFSAVERVTWAGGTGQMLAINSTTAPTKMWIQLLSGVVPVNNEVITGATSAATCQLNVTVTERLLSQPFVGLSTGTSIIGAYGLGIQVLDLSATDKLIDLTNTQRTPPNNVTFTVSGVVSGEDYVIVGPRGYRFDYDNEGGTPPFVVGETLTFTSPAGTAKLAELRDNGSTGRLIIGPMLTGAAPADNSTITGGTSGATADVNGTPADAIDTRQFTLNGALTGAAVTAVVVTESIPGDTPATGTIRIKRANGVYSRHPYSAYDAGTKTFTITSHDFSTNNAANGANCYISYLDKLADATQLSFTAIYAADRDLFVRVRDGGASPIKTFETTATVSSAGGSATVVRTSDA